MNETLVTLSVEEHFDTLREPVWARFRARHGLYARDRFDDAYAEFWLREVERVAAGRPSRCGTPVAFVCEAVHRVMIDEARSRARGLARGEEKAAFELLDLDDQRDAAGADDVASAAHYEAVVHRVLQLVRSRLTPRELQVFVWSFLYLSSSSVTASALGLSEPRVKKDRRKIAAKVGEEVWAVLGAELGCAGSAAGAYTDNGLLAVCELLTDHVEDCSSCSGAVGGIRRGALAVVAPVELLALRADEPAHLLDTLVAKLCTPFHRAAEVAVAMPSGGRAAAATALAAAAIGGGTVATHASRPAEPSPHAGAAAHAGAPPSAPVPSATPAVTVTPVPTAHATPAPTRSASPRTAKRRAAPRRSTRESFTPVPTAAPATTVAPPPPLPTPTAAPAAPSAAGTEFGFEQGQGP